MVLVQNEVQHLVHLPLESSFVDLIQASGAPQSRTSEKSVLASLLTEFSELAPCIVVLQVYAIIVAIVFRAKAALIGPRVKFHPTCSQFRPWAVSFIDYGQDIQNAARGAVAKCYRPDVCAVADSSRTNTENMRICITI